ncbi:MAG: porin family protein [Gemmatimonadota bacterium]|nr:porin family protein [Gemmatimonadota bacterium]
MKRALTLAVAGIVVPIVVAGAQSTGARFGVEAAPFYTTVEGDDFEGIDAGLGFDVQGRFSWPAWSFGLGWQRSSHRIDELSDDLIVTSFFVEPRFQFPVQGELRPYFLVRGGLANQRLDADIPGFGTFDIESSGVIIGLGAGLAFPVAPSIDVNFSVMWAWLSFDDVEANGQEVPDSDSRGSGVLLRAGVSYTFGRR